MKTKTKNLKNSVAGGYPCTFGKLLKVLHPSCGVATGYSYTDMKGHKVLQTSTKTSPSVGRGRKFSTRNEC